VRVWVTRSEPGASRMAARLAEAGYETVVAPVLTIEPLPVSDSALDSVRARLAKGAVDAVFLSEHAVEPGLRALQLAGVGSRRLRVIAVGPRTAERLAEFGLQALAPALASSEGLLAMPEFAKVAGRKIIILAGEGGRDQLRQGLAERGAQVDGLALYRRRPVPEKCLQGMIETAQIQAISVSSGDGFQSAAQVWFAARGRPDVAVFTPSARVTGMGEGLGFSRVFTCNGADVCALIDGLANFAG